MRQAKVGPHFNASIPRLTNNVKQRPRPTGAGAVRPLLHAVTTNTSAYRPLGGHLTNLGVPSPVTSLP